MNGEVRVVYEFARVASSSNWLGGAIDAWWFWALTILVTVVAITVCVVFYRRDAAELTFPVRWTLIGLRLVAIGGLVFLFMDLIRRTERRVERESEVVVLIDTSQSMLLPAGNDPDGMGRIDQARTLLDESELVGRLSNDHRVSVYTFDAEDQPRLLASTSIASTTDATASDAEASPTKARSWQQDGMLSARLAALVLMMGAFFGVVSLLLGAWRARGTRHTRGQLASGPNQPRSICLALSAGLLVTGIVWLGSLYCVHSDLTLRSLIVGDGDALQDLAPDALDGSDVPDGIKQPERDSDGNGPVDWEAALIASGSQSRLGDAVRSILADHDATTLAGLVVLSDGQNNGGGSLSQAVATARRDGVSIYPVGLGSSTPPTNVRVVDLESPRRVYPEDRFPVTAVVQATGPDAMECQVELIDVLASDEASAGTTEESFEWINQGEVVASQRIRLDPNDATENGLKAVRFEIRPETVGQRRLAVRVVPPPGDRNASDDVRATRYEVIARKLHVLAIAGGPTREYRFVRNLLHRDASVEVDVWLQTGQQGMSQDASAILERFPRDAEELFQYDAVILFDPDWSAIDAASLDLLDRLLTQQAGGLAIVAGPVYHARLSQRQTRDASERLTRIAGFFPVNLATRGPLIESGRQGGRTDYRLEMTPEAMRADFMDLGESPELTTRVWDRFGVYDYVSVKSAKPGAKVYARFSDPTTEIGGSLPIFMASQFYGAGRVFFLASGEMWRLRSSGDAYFNRFYTKLLRWVSEGRLLRDSKRGVLLVDAERAMVGQTITIRAVLVDDQFQPLDDPDVTAQWLLPDGTTRDVRMLRVNDSPQGGTYTATFIAMQSGDHEIQLSVGNGLDENVLHQTVSVRLPRSELERPRRNDDGLASLASATRGQYLPVGDGENMDVLRDKVVGLIAPQPQVTVLPGTPDTVFALRRNATLLWLIATALTFEWVTRRLHRLA
ncbi:MAG: vWA domain-containing protein [Planctomycetota bacterium]